MVNAEEAEARLRRSLANLRQEIAALAEPPEEAKDSFEDTLRSAMDRIKRLLGLG